MYLSKGMLDRSGARSMARVAASSMQAIPHGCSLQCQSQMVRGAAAAPLVASTWRLPRSSTKSPRGARAPLSRALSTQQTKASATRSASRVSRARGDAPAIPWLQRTMTTHADCHHRPSISPPCPLQHCPHLSIVHLYLGALIDQYPPCLSRTNSSPNRTRRRAPP